MRNNHQSVLRFGIPSLDSLISGKNGSLAGIPLDEERSTSLSIIGPDGTGKSVLGLHLASHYLYDHREPKICPLVLYVSTDLSYSMALGRTWAPFGLDYPGEREVPFNDAEPVTLLDAGRGKVSLRKLAPVSDASTNEDRDTLSSFIMRSDRVPADLEVGFVDLAANTAGDDWGLVNRIVALLPTPSAGEPLHLIVLDAIEGFETLVGELDAYGHISSRRSRIAQIMRSAHDKCHLVFVAEEPSENHRIPEQFVTDVVLRLRKRDVGDYIRRTLEVEKARGQEHVRGMHPYVIRSGRGSTTGDQQNPDDPSLTAPGLKELDDTAGAQRSTHAGEPSFQAYIHIFPSLHHYSRAMMQQRGGARPSRPEDKFAGFGIRYLDNMLAGAVDRPMAVRNGFETMGLPCATVTALIGDSLTQKTRLGRAFLSRCFANYPKLLVDLAQSLMKGPAYTKEYLLKLRKTEPLLVDLIRQQRSQIARARAGGAQQVLALAATLLERAERKEPDGVAVLFTTADVDARAITQDFSRWLLRDVRGALEFDNLRDILEKYCHSRTICRRLEVHDLSSPILMHIVQRAIRHAQSILLGSRPVPTDLDLRFECSHPIRIVIDDFSALLATYSEVKTDPLFLPTLLFHLRREGVSSLIIDTHSGQPGVYQTGGLDSELRTLVDQRLYTWYVPFYGENRVAIAPIPPLSKAAVRELRTARLAAMDTYVTDDRSDDEDLVVDPEFEMYAGLEERRPQPVPLEIHVHEETPVFRTYIDKENVFYRNLFAPNSTLTGMDRGVLISRSGEDYEGFENFCYLDNNVRLDHTLIFEVDEFWAIRAANALADLAPYLNEEVTTERLRSSSGDPFGLFQPTLADTDADRRTRARYHAFPRYFDRNASQLIGRVDRVPFTWDFGLMICRKRPWESAASEHDLVRKCWTSLRKVNDPPDSRKAPRPTVSWTEFLSAAREVARRESTRAGVVVPAFDLSLLAPESFSCLALEIWASEIAADEIASVSHVSERDWGSQARALGILEWLDEGQDFRSLYESWKKGSDVKFRGHWLSLYKTWLLLGETLNLSSLVDDVNQFEFRQRGAEPSAIASRQWYKTASTTAHLFSASDPVTCLQLPGLFSVRGDWFLAASKNSRSIRLAHRAMDLLSSRRANINRLQMGVGLPVRDILPVEAYERTRTCLFKSGVSGERRTVAYADLLYIGAHREVGQPEAASLNWLWRSSLKNYDRHSRVFRKWLCRMMILIQQLQHSIGREWIDNFEILKRLSAVETDPKERARFFKSDLKSMDEFVKRLAFLITELKQSSPAES